MGFAEMEPIFGNVKAEWSAAPHQTPLNPFLFHVRGLPHDPSTLRVLATDYHSNTWEALKSTQDLEDMRDRTGIGGSWPDFVDYLIASLKSEDVKLVMDGQSKFGGAAHAKLVAQKAKGMPRITISFSKLVDTTATEAMAHLSLELYKTYKNVTNLLKTEQQWCCELTNVVSAEKEKNEIAQKQLDALVFSKRQKYQKIADNTTSDTATVSCSQVSPDKQAAQLPSTKVSNRVVPVHRRARVRGVLLHDTEDDTQD